MPLGTFRINSLAKIISVSGGGGTRDPIIMTPYGNAQMSTSVKKFGTASYAGDGSSDSLRNNNLGSYATKDFTYEFWMNPNSVSGNHWLGVLGSNTNNDFCAVMFYRNGSTMRLYASSTGTSWDAASGLALGTVVTGQWYHMAVTRSGNTLKAYQDGVLYQTVTLTNNLHSGTAFAVGATARNGGSFNGYIDEVRVSNSVRYTSNFTPSSTAFTNDINTDILLHCDGLNGQTLFPDDIGANYTMALITPNITSTVEQESVTFSMETLNTDSTIYYSLDGTVSADDFTSNSLTGTVNLTNNKGTLVLTSTANVDSPTGAETFVLNLRTGSVSGNIIASSSTITINDTGISNTWDTYTVLNMMTDAVRYTGLNQFSFNIQGLQNTDNLVFVFGSQNLARNKHYLYPAVFNLTSKQFAIGSAIDVGNTQWSTVTFQTLAVAGEGNIGICSLAHLVGTSARTFIKGFTISNWGSITPTNLPTLSLSSAYVRGTDSASLDVYCSFAGNNRFMTSQYDATLADGGGYNHGVQTVSYSANGSVASLSTSAATGGRGLGQVTCVRNGISSNNYAAHIWFPGGNNNTVSVAYAQGTGSTTRVNANGANLPSSAGGAMNSVVYNTPSAKAFIFSQLGNSNVNTFMSVSEWTNPNVPANNPSITIGTYFDGHTNPGRLNAIIPKGDTTTSTSFYTPVYVSSTQHRFDTINTNTSTRTYTSKDTGVDNNGAWYGDMYWKPYYHPTYGQYIFQWNHNTSNNIRLYIHKWNP